MKPPFDELPHCIQDYLYDSFGCAAVLEEGGDPWKELRKLYDELSSERLHQLVCAAHTYFRGATSMAYETLRYMEVNSFENIVKEDDAARF